MMRVAGTMRCQPAPQESLRCRNTQRRERTGRRRNPQITDAGYTVAEARCATTRQVYRLESLVQALIPCVLQSITSSWAARSAARAAAARAPRDSARDSARCLKHRAASDQRSSSFPASMCGAISSAAAPQPPARASWRRADARNVTLQSATAPSCPAAARAGRIAAPPPCSAHFSARPARCACFAARFAAAPRTRAAPVHCSIARSSSARSPAAA